MPKEERKVGKGRGSAGQDGTRPKRGRGEEINLGKIEDKAWLGALIVGEGSIFTKGPAGKIKRVPVLAVMMEDKAAIDKAAALMGVRTTAAGRSPITGRPYWRVCAIGARAIKVLDSVRRFMTTAKLTQAERVITAARDAGFRTVEEMKEERKLLLLKYLELRPGSPPRPLEGQTGVPHAVIRRYFEELEQDGKVWKIDYGIGRRPRTKWFVVKSSLNSKQESKRTEYFMAVLPGEMSLPSSREQEESVIGRARTGHQTSKETPGAGIRNKNPAAGSKGLRGKPGGDIRLGNTEDRAWLAALIVGEGSIHTRGKKGKVSRQPCIVVRMQDSEAIEKAAFLMGVRRSAAGVSESSGNQFWSATAVGGRAIGVIELIRPFITPTRSEQADQAILLARKTGFRSKPEMREMRKQFVEECIRLRPGSFTSKVGIQAGTTGRDLKRYLEELERDGKVRPVNVGTIRRPRHRWFPCGT
ncbi:MAG: hypothetical protein OK455_01395 [Thaumarchaeota archaeon]|nr:hypothetical protein [Nitrososphaerota archaeon]